MFCSLQANWAFPRHEKRHRKRIALLFISGETGRGNLNLPVTWRRKARLVQLDPFSTDSPAIVFIG